ncbi:MAG: AMMECR1 domain-containing protein [Bacteroidales bacterium]
MMKKIGHVSAKSIYTKVALSAIIKNLGEDIEWIESIDLPEEDLLIKRGCFVSLHRRDSSLRGCIGTIEPQEKNLREEIIRNAYSAAFRDTRFSPLSIEELEDLEVSVDVLTEPETISDLGDLRDPKSMVLFRTIRTTGQYCFRQFPKLIQLRNKLT